MAVLLALSIVPTAAGGVNYEGSQVPDSVLAGLPDPLVCADGTKVVDVETWKTRRRPELLRLFETNIYGRSPGRPGGMTFKITAVDPAALDGKATRKQVTVYFNGRSDDGHPVLCAQRRGQARACFSRPQFRRESRGLL
jgi:hypothetical protein